LFAMSDTTNTGKALERRIADAYRRIGARVVKHDVNLAGNQIDVYVELETPGRFLHRVAVEAKDWKSPVGVDVVNRFATIVNLLHHERLVDEGAIVSANGFTRPARDAAQTYGIRLLELGDVEAMERQVAEAEASNIRYLSRILATLSQHELARLLYALPVDAQTSIYEQAPASDLLREYNERLSKGRVRMGARSCAPVHLVRFAFNSGLIPQLVDAGKKVCPAIHWPEVVSE